MKISSEIEVSSEIVNFKRKLEIFKRSSEIDFFQDSGPLEMSAKERKGPQKSANASPQKSAKSSAARGAEQEVSAAPQQSEICVKYFRYSHRF